MDPDVDKEAELARDPHKYAFAATLDVQGVGQEFTSRRQDGRLPWNDAEPKKRQDGYGVLAVEKTVEVEEIVRRIIEPADKSEPAAGNVDRVLHYEICFG